MEDKTSNSSISATATTVQNAGPSTGKAGDEHRQVYGTAKTENLRDSGLWRFIIPAFTVLASLGLLAIPLIILIPLLYNSLTPHGAGDQAVGQLTWIWVTMIVLEVTVAAVIIRGLVRVFMTQAGNYSH